MGGAHQLQDSGGTVYGTGLRRCLIILAPQTAILDRGRQASLKEEPSPQLVSYRSKNFTSDTKVPFTPWGCLPSEIE